MQNHLLITSDEDAFRRIAKAIGLSRVGESGIWDAFIVENNKLLARNIESREPKKEMVLGALFGNLKFSIPRKFREEELKLAEAESRAALDARQNTFGYYINLNERGSFSADVRTFNGKTLYAVLGGDELPSDAASLVDDGFMSSFKDADGHREYLCQMGVLPSGAELLSSSDFDRHCQKTQELINGIQTVDEVRLGFASSMELVQKVLEELESERRQAATRMRHQAMTA